MIIGVIIVVSIAAIMTVVYLALLLIDVYSYKIVISRNTFRHIKTTIIICIIVLFILGVIWYARKF